MTSGEASVRQRTGPRPLGLHLGLAQATLASSLAALVPVREGHFPWMADLAEDADRLRQDMAGFAVEDLLTEIGQHGHQQIGGMLRGIQKYHAHPYRRTERDVPVLWSEGGSRLLDYGTEDQPDTGPVALIIPSLINRSYILDLFPGRSFVDALAAQGIRPLLMDWGEVTDVERDYGLDEYVLNKLEPAAEAVFEACPSAPVHLVGYCMGGTLAMALATRMQARFASFVALAAPWNFHEGLSQAGRLFLGERQVWERVLGAFGELPVDMLQAFFASLDPSVVLQKFSLFDRMDPDSLRAQEFVALEDWLNDGVPLAAKVAEQCFREWYGSNLPYGGAWRIGGKIVSPEILEIPSMIAVPKSDKIVPPGSALGLAGQIPGARIIYPPSGHIGMVASRHAQDGLWRDVIRWVTQ
ncbi:alpha/beta fold hydrolase [Sneathiella chinensis]|uniref:Alpha/beta hydrolase n=1 Tax=Sneathiella chinensis TaxID=349750 RepID=A0ABQ5U0X3_9PROT|nr:alpha/beta fold hydrolase [Sneathiella chinensis]GLQ05296.1 alpha/beta hydrolase [Sneathiella chinensis]